MRVIVVGGGAAGMTCASQLARHRPVDVTVLERGAHVSFSACGIPGWLGGRIPGGPDRLVALDADTAREDRGIDVRTQASVQGVDPQARTVQLDGDELAYDKLVLATGVAPLDPFDARRAANVFAFRHLDDGIDVETYLTEEDPRRACVVGGGFVGIEIAEALTRRGLDVRLVQAHDTLVGARLNDELGQTVAEHLEATGVDVRTGTEAETVVVDGDRARTVQLDDGTRLDPDMVVLATGTRPRTELAEHAGCRLTDAGAIVVDEAMRTTVEDVLACGDCVAYRHRLSGELVRQPLALHANRGGRVAAATIRGEQAQFPGILGTAAAHVADLDIALTGLTAREARSAGLEPVTATIDAETKAGYEPDAAPVKVHLVAEHGNGRLLGGQIVGGPGAGLRIDTLAAALWTEATCRDLERMDLAYTPSLSPTWDPLAVAARMAAREAAP